MNILITGANGQLGSEMQEISKGSIHKFFFTDVDDLDISKNSVVKSYVADNVVDVIVNCAAYTNVDGAEDNRDIAEMLNNRAVRNLADAAKVVNATLIHISTDYVFDGTGYIPYTEENSTAPSGVYGKTKLDGEQSIEKSGCDYIIIRTSWLYSQYGNNFVKTIKRLSAERDKLNVVFDQVGTPTYAADLANVILHIINTNQLYKKGVYHFSNEGVCSWYDFAVEIASLSGNDCIISPCHSDEFPSKVKRPHYSVLDKTKIKETFGVEISHWKEALIRCIHKINRHEQ